MSDYFIFMKRYKEACNALTLGKCLKQRLWEKTSYPLKQLVGIGQVTAKVIPCVQTLTDCIEVFNFGWMMGRKISWRFSLVEENHVSELTGSAGFEIGMFWHGTRLFQALLKAGVDSFDKLAAADPRRLELITGRKYPFGNQVKSALDALPPRVDLKLFEVGFGKIECCLTRLSPANRSSKHIADLVSWLVQTWLLYTVCLWDCPGKYFTSSIVYLWSRMQVARTWVFFLPHMLHRLYLWAGSQALAICSGCSLCNSELFTSLVPCPTHAGQLLCWIVSWDIQVVGNKEENRLLFHERIRYPCVQYVLQQMQFWAESFGGTAHVSVGVCLTDWINSSGEHNSTFVSIILWRWHNCVNQA